MKNLWLLITFLPLFLFGQTSVPNTETFSLQDVYNAVHSHTSGTQTNLQSCFDNAISGYFNATYNQDSYAPPNSMLRFRDYKPSSPTCEYPIFYLLEYLHSYSCGSYSFISSEALADQACSDINNAGCQVYATEGSGYRAQSFAVGYQVYTSGGACSQFVISQWGLYQSGGVTYKVHINNGIIDVISQCYP